MTKKKSRTKNLASKKVLRSNIRPSQKLKRANQTEATPAPQEKDLGSKYFVATEIIAKKRDGLELSPEEIQWFIEQYLENKIADYQVSALLMAIYLNGMSKKETATLTKTMLYSGKVLPFVNETVVDKHSTGGVGDKTSFIIAPLARACGLKVPMIAGRGLGHTGGTVDKVESIEGFKTGLSLEQFSQQLKSEGIVLIGQTNEIAPADKRIYALRDVTSTIESVPLITASIMSKKLAEGARGYVFDIKYGQGAFMKSPKRARELAKSLMKTCEDFDKDVCYCLTDMNAPLGLAIGNSLEIIECIEVLKGRGPEDLKDISVYLTACMVYLGGKAKTIKDAEKMVYRALKSGEGLNWFRKLIILQGGNPDVLEDYSKFPIANEQTAIIADTKGHIHEILPIDLGMFLVRLGGGRQRKEDKIDFSVGIQLTKQVGDKVEKGECIGLIFHHEHQRKEVESFLIDRKQKVFVIKKGKSKKRKLILESKVSKNFHK